MVELHNSISNLPTIRNNKQSSENIKEYESKNNNENS